MNVRRISCAVALSLILAGVQARLASQSTGSSATECTVAAVQAKAPKGTTITSATIVAAVASRMPRNALMSLDGFIEEYRQVAEPVDEEAVDHLPHGEIADHRDRHATEEVVASQRDGTRPGDQPTDGPSTERQRLDEIQAFGQSPVEWWRLADEVGGRRRGFAEADQVGPEGTGAVSLAIEDVSYYFEDGKKLWKE